MRRAYRTAGTAATSAHAAAISAVGLIPVLASVPAIPPCWGVGWDAEASDCAVVDAGAALFFWLAAFFAVAAAVDACLLSVEVAAVLPVECSAVFD